MAIFQNYELDLTPRSVWRIAPAQREDLPFQVQEAGHFDARRGYFTERQGKADYLLLYTLEGNGLLRYREGEWPLPPGSMVYLDSQRFHLYQTGPGSAENWRFYWMHVSGPHCSTYEQIIYPGGFAVRKPGRSPDIEGKFARALEHIEDPHLLARCITSDCAGGILTELAAAGPDARGTAGPHREGILRAVAYIRSHFDQAIDLDTLAAQAQLSRYHFLRLFRQHMQMTPYHYLTHYRINEAKKLLNTTGLQVSRVGELVGFSDPCNFNRTFKAMTGLTPYRYRNG